MPSNLFTHDFISILLINSNFDISISLKEAIDKTNIFQIENNIHYGIDREDFTSAIFMLILENFARYDMESAICELKVYDIIPIALNYFYIYFNDEGNNWIEDKDEKFFDSIFNMSYIDFSKKNVLRKQIVDYFKGKDLKCLSKFDIENFVNKLKITKKSIIEYSRTGSSS